MSLFCAISNEIPENPVVSPVSGAIFKKDLILKYLKEQGDTDPINGEKLTEDMLIEIKSNPLVKPLPPSATSIPGLLKCLQEEWDSIILNNFTLRQQLQTVRQELSHTLYQHDASCRVIARLTKEVTAAREALISLKPQSIVTLNSDGPSLLQPTGMNDDISDSLQKYSTMLTSERKKRSKTGIAGVATLDEVREYKLLSTHSGLHSAASPGILCLDVSVKDNGKFIATGGNDGNVVVFNKDEELVVHSLKGHTKKVTTVLFHPTEDVIISSSRDSTIRLWNLNDESGNVILNVHADPISAISLDPSGRYLLSGARDGNWGLTDINKSQLIMRVREDELHRGINCAKFHPDGLIFGLGNSNSTVRIWDPRRPINVASFDRHTGSITSMSFSENGYYLATSGEDSQVIIWDLRKLKDIHTIKLDDNYDVRSVSFDNNGMCLALAGTDIRVYRSKQWELVNTFQENTALVTNVRFSQNYLASTCFDRCLRVFGNSS